MNKSLSPSEAFLWDYVNEHFVEIPDLAISSLADRAMVSKATVIRTFQKKGFKGYSDFKFYLENTKNTRVDDTVLKDAGEDIKRIILKNEQEVIRTLNELDVATIESAAMSIKEAQRVIIFARGPSEMTAVEMQTKLMLLDKDVMVFTDPNIIRPISHRKMSHTVVIMLSLSGETVELVQASKTLSEQHIPIITITANMQSPLVKNSTVVLNGFKSVVSQFPEFEVRSRLPIEVIARVLMDVVAIRIGTIR